MSDPDLPEHAVSAFEHAVANIPGMRSREGQKHMVHHIARTLGPVTLGENEQPVRGISVVHAGTGVGKSLAYAAPCIALAQAKDCRLILTTATVTLNVVKRFFQRLSKVGLLLGLRFLLRSNHRVGDGRDSFGLTRPGHIRLNS